MRSVVLGKVVMVQKSLSQINKDGNWRKRPSFTYKSKGLKKKDKKKMAFKQWKARGFKIDALEET
jgi:hypothetical protein